MSSTNPTILLVPGAFTEVSCYDLLAPLLEKAGYPTARAPLPSSNPPDPYGHTAKSDGEALLNKNLLPLIEEGKGVVVFAHSFGATANSGAGSGVTKREREAKGLKGGVVGIVWFTTALVPEGKSQVEYLGGTMPLFCKLDYVSPLSTLCLFDMSC
jgi:hypothetical protein